MIKGLLFALIVAPCVAERVAQVEDLSPEEIAVPTQPPTISMPSMSPTTSMPSVPPTVSPTSSPQTGPTSSCTFNFWGLIAQWSKAFLTNFVNKVKSNANVPSGVQVKSKLRQIFRARFFNERAAMPAQSLEPVVVVDLTFLGADVKTLQAVAQNVVTQANTADSPLRHAIEQDLGLDIESVTVSFLWTQTPVEAGDKLSDGGIAGIVVGSVVVGIVLLVVLYCFVCKAEPEPAVEPENPYGNETGAHLQHPDEIELDLKDGQA